MRRHFAVPVGATIGIHEPRRTRQRRIHERHSEQANPAAGQAHLFFFAQAHREQLPFACEDRPIIHDIPQIRAGFPQNRSLGQGRAKKSKIAISGKSTLKDFAFRSRICDVCDSRIDFGYPKIPKVDFFTRSRRQVSESLCLKLWLSSSTGDEDRRDVIRLTKLSNSRQLLPTTPLLRLTFE